MIYIKHQWYLCRLHIHANSCLSKKPSLCLGRLWPNEIFLHSGFGLSAFPWTPQKKKKKHGLLLPGYPRLLVVGFAHLSITIGFLGSFSLFGADSRVTQGWQQWWLERGEKLATVIVMSWTHPKDSPNCEAGIKHCSRQHSLNDPPESMWSMHVHASFSLNTIDTHHREQLQHYKWSPCLSMLDLWLIKGTCLKVLLHGANHVSDHP